MKLYISRKIPLSLAFKDFYSPWESHGLIHKYLIPNPQLLILILHDKKSLSIINVASTEEMGLKLTELNILRRKCILFEFMMGLCYITILKATSTFHEKNLVVFQAILILAFRQYDFLKNIFLITDSALS